MRNKIAKSLENRQGTIGQIDIASIKLDIKSRDQIPEILLGLQYLHKDKVILEQVYEILEREIVAKRGIKNDEGRPGMDLWQILVSGVLRLNNNWDYDHLENMVNSHREIRQMLGLGFWDEGLEFRRKTLRNNISLISPEAFSEIGDLIVRAGHQFLEVENEDLKARVDSFVLESNIKHPTDSNLLMDSIRKVFHVILFLEEMMETSLIGQSKKELKAIKKLFNKLRKMRRSTSQNEKARKRRNQAIQETHQSFLAKIQDLIGKVNQVVDKISDDCLDDDGIAMKIGELSSYLDYAAYHIDLINRRVLQGETIPQNEKIYSIFEYYTEWIVKGKAKAPVELGLRVAVMDDQFNFILNSQVMYQSIEEQLEILRADEITRKQITDEKITIPFTQKALEKFPRIKIASFDKGFYSVSNKKDMEELEVEPILPKKGKLSEKDKQRQSSMKFINGRKRHSGIESTIHALENHGLDFCPDKGLTAFRRYVSCAVLARNIQVFGSHIKKKEREKKRLEKEWEKEKILKAA